MIKHGIVLKFRFKQKDSSLPKTNLNCISTFSFSILNCCSKLIPLSSIPTAPKPEINDGIQPIDLYSARLQADGL